MIWIKLYSIPSKIWYGCITLLRSTPTRLIHNKFSSSFSSLFDQIHRGVVPNLTDRNSEEDKQLVQSLTAKIKDPQHGVTCKDRTYHLKTYKNCFLGTVRNGLDFVLYCIFHRYSIFLCLCSNPIGSGGLVDEGSRSEASSGSSQFGESNDASVQSIWSCSPQTRFRRWRIFLPLPFRTTSAIRESCYYCCCCCCCNPWQYKYKYKLFLFVNWFKIEIELFPFSVQLIYVDGAFLSDANGIDRYP